MAPVKRDSHSGIWFATFNTTDKVGELRGCYVVTFLFSGETNWTLFFFFIGSVGLLNLTHFDNCPSIRISHVGARPDWHAYVGRCFNVKSKFVPEFPMPTQTYFVLRRRLLHSHAHPKYSDDVGTGAELKKKKDWTNLARTSGTSVTVVVPVNIVRPHPHFLFFCLEDIEYTLHLHTDTHTIQKDWGFKIKLRHGWLLRPVYFERVYRCQKSREKKTKTNEFIHANWRKNLKNNREVFPGASCMDLAPKTTRVYWLFCRLVSVQFFKHLVWTSCIFLGLFQW